MMWPFGMRTPEDNGDDRQGAPSNEVKDYGFSFEVAFRGAENGLFHQHGFDDKVGPEAGRTALIASLTKAIKEKDVVSISDNLVMRGDEISWFVVRRVKEWRVDWSDDRGSSAASVCS